MAVGSYIGRIDRNLTIMQTTPDSTNNTNHRPSLKWSTYNVHQSKKTTAADSHVARVVLVAPQPCAVALVGYARVPLDSIG
ncbi:hypothetical protein CTheo_6860 [Ceratobasidium theobromae]|uniref:Uncharacterized protein n=1 Tax=Ceratobasidium theobromae TaxID=1582974 RepID=A0A5N5QDT3_9AGAM|nr:hypothetical protein CTheo_6860 [Ceratobasidium theobromae]